MFVTQPSLFLFSACSFLASLVTVQCDQRKLEFPGYEFDSHTANALINQVFSTNCDHFQEFWIRRSDFPSSLITQSIDKCNQVTISNLLPLLTSARSTSNVTCDAYEYFVMHNDTRTMQQTVDIVNNQECLIHHLILYDISKYGNYTFWWENISNFKNYLNKTNASNLLIANEIAFYVTMTTDDKEDWINAATLFDQQCGAGISLTVTPAPNENQTALLTYSPNMTSLLTNEIVELSTINADLYRF